MSTAKQSSMNHIAASLTGQSPCRPATPDAARCRAVLLAVDLLRRSGEASVAPVADALERGVLHRTDINVELGLKRRRGGARDTPYERARRGVLEVELVALAENLGENPTAAARTILQMVRDGHERTFMLRTLGNVPRSVEGVARVIRTAVKA